MTVEDLRNLLEELIEDGRGGDEVRIVFQPRYPIQTSVMGVATSETVARALEDYDDGTAELDEDDRYVVWVVAGYHEDYAPRAVYDAVIRW